MALVGKELFSDAYGLHLKNDDNEKIQKWNFVDIFHSFMIVFLVLTGEWIEPMWDCLNCMNPAESKLPCFLFFLCVKIVGGFVVSFILLLKK